MKYEDEEIVMTPEEFISAFIEKYELKDFFNFRRSSGKNLYYKKVLIWILRMKFHMSFPQIGKIFRNGHMVIMWHFNDASGNRDLGRYVEDAWEIHRNFNRKEASNG